MLLQICALSVTMLVVVLEGMPTGAPEEACDLLQPKHKEHKPQPSSTFPYTVTMSKDTYSSPQDKITVLLQSPEGSPPFKGFLIAARNEQNAPFGSWDKTPSGHQLSCSAITHNDNKDKTSVSLTWSPPANATSGRITMSAAVVQNVSIFWAHIPVKVGPTLVTASRRMFVEPTTVLNTTTTVTTGIGKSTTESSKQKPTTSPAKLR